MAITNWMASLALVNGTAGGIVLVLPIIGLQAGWLMIPIIIFIASLCCYYTATLMFMHLGKASTINNCILNHFNNQKYCDFYNFTMFVSFFGEMILYFDLLVSETQGILYFGSEEVKYLVPFCVAGFLIFLAIVTRYFNQEDYLLGYGILSMIAYAIFIVWIICKNNPGPLSIPIVKDNFVELSAAISQGYSIHNMMIPIILRSQSPQDYKKILMNVFVIGGLFYTLVAYGSFGLIHRGVMSGGDGDTVEDYFIANQWEVFILRAIYIVNIITVFPEFLSISKTRFFNMFEDQQQYQHHYESENKRLQIRQIIYYVLIVGICLVAKIMKLSAPMIIELNGSIICFVEIYLIPIGIHLKCVWWDYSKHYQDEDFAIQHGDYYQCVAGNVITKRDHYNEDVNYHKAQGLNIEQLSAGQQNRARQQIPNQLCPYHKQLATPTKRYTQISISLVVLSYGLFVMLYTFYTVFIKQQV